MKYINTLIKQFKDMDAMDQIGQVISIPLNVLLAVLAVTSGWWGYAPLFALIIYVNWTCPFWKDDFHFDLSVLHR